MTIGPKRTGVLLALVAASALLVPSGAAQFLPLSPADQIGGQVELQPAPGPAGNYSYLEDGQLVVDLSASNPNLEGEGVNPEAVTGVGGVFRIHYNGTRYAEVWLTHEADGIEFTAEGHSIQSRGNNVTLGPNETVAVGVTVDTTGSISDARIDDITVHARVAEPETVGTDGSGGAVGTAQVGQEEPVVSLRSPDAGTRAVTIENAPVDAAVGADLQSLVLDEVTDGGTLTLDRVAVTSSDGGRVAFRVRVVELASAETAAPPLPDEEGVAMLGAYTVDATDGADGVASARFAFSAAPGYLDARGTTADVLRVYHYEDGSWVSLGTTPAGERDGKPVFESVSPGFSTFAVAMPVANVGVRAVSANATSLDADESVRVTATVHNDGAAAGNRTLALRVDGAASAQRSVRLGPNESTTVTFETVLVEPGEHALTVGNASGVTVQVAEPMQGAPTTTAEPTPTTTVATTRATEPTTTAPVVEPASIELPKIVGLGLLLAIVVAGVVLVRRVSVR